MKATTVILIAAAAVLAAFSLTGCVTDPISLKGNGNYVTGDLTTENEVKALEIDWTAGTVTVSATDQTTVRVTETCNAELKEEQRMQTWLDGTTLHVRYCKPGVHFNLTEAEKTLTITLPKTILDSLSYDGTSANAEFTDISAASFAADATSGNLTLNGCSSNQFDLTTTSGDMTLALKESTDSLKADSTSGKVTLTADAVRTLTVDTTSGDAELSVQQTETVKTGGTSGKRTLTLGNMPKVLTVSSTAGDVTLCIPQNSEFTATVDTATGDFNSDISLSKKGGSFVSGSGENKLEIDTTSGNVNILAAE